VLRSMLPDVSWWASPPVWCSHADPCAGWWWQPREEAAGPVLWGCAWPERTNIGAKRFNKHLGGGG
jgi:hypothetical protein